MHFIYILLACLVITVPSEAAERGVANLASHAEAQYLGSLPKDPFLMILSDLSASDLMKASLVSRSWNQGVELIAQARVEASTGDQVRFRQVFSNDSTEIKSLLTYFKVWRNVYRLGILESIFTVSIITGETFREFEEGYKTKKFTTRDPEPNYLKGPIAFDQPHLPDPSYAYSTWENVCYLPPAFLASMSDWKLALTHRLPALPYSFKLCIHSPIILGFLFTQMSNMKGLLRLDLLGNQLRRLPAEIAQLEGLRVLHLQNNNLMTLPAQITNLTNLEELNLNHNPSLVLGPEIGQLVKLKKLNLEDNNLTGLPLGIYNLTTLEELDVSQNNLLSLSEEIGNLPKLKQINISDNYSVDIPEAVLSKLRAQGTVIIAFS